MSKKKWTNSISGKGYYIALILCAVAIGISGYLYYRNANDIGGSIQNNPMSSDNQGNGDVQAVATQPSDQQPTDGTQGTEQTDPIVLPPRPYKTTAPVNGQTAAEYAMDCLSYNQTTRDWRVHNGIDYAAEAGTPVVAAADGTVYTVYDDEAMGVTVVISHADGYVTKYSSLAEEVQVQPGDTVEMGQTLGCVGNSALLESAIGDHIHFSVTYNDRYVDPADFLTQE
ncbi:MAG: M23 family metallopeptidase [Oscillospiraceae bacterium]|nr:M23 family metallopeptidase [Oscillospiraceae bacterium]